MPGAGRRPGLSLVSSEEEVAFYTARAASGPVLVLGAAHQRLIWVLAERGRAVHVVEPAAPILEALEASRVAEPPDVASRVEATAADFRAFRVETRFPFVFAPRNVLGLVGRGNLDAVFATVRHHLAPVGSFVFDVVSPPRSGPPAPSLSEAHTPLRASEPPRPIFAPHLRERSRAPGLGSSIHRLMFRPFSSDELDRALRESGLTALERYGSFTSKPYEPLDPLQLVVAAPSA